MKTVWITSFHSLISRNILMAGLPDALVRDGFEVMLAVPSEKVAYFESRFGKQSVRILSVATALNRYDVFFQKLALALTPTRATYIKRRADARGLSFLFFLVTESLIRLIRIVPGIHSFIRFLDRSMTHSSRVKGLFDSHPCDLLCSTDIQNEIDVRLLQEAKRRHVQTLGLVRSWDNITSKGIPRVLPSVFGVSSDIVAEELRTIGVTSETPIRVIGIPHHDSYWKYQPKDKKLFLDAWGFDSGKPVVLFAPIGDRYIRENSLDRMVLEKLSELDVNILVRLPPTDVVTLEGFSSRKAIVAFHKTGARPWKGDRGPGASKRNEISEEDEAALKEELSHADVLVTGQSTLVIDAAIFDVPSVVVNFDSEPRGYYDSVRRYYDYDYYRPILESGGIALANSPSELIEAVAAYIKNPENDAGGRKRIAREQSPYGGKALNQLVVVIKDICAS